MMRSIEGGATTGEYGGISMCPKCVNVGFLLPAGPAALTGHLLEEASVLRSGHKERRTLAGRDSHGFREDRRPSFPEAKEERCSRFQEDNVHAPRSSPALA